MGRKRGRDIGLVCEGGKLLDWIGLEREERREDGEMEKG